MLFSFPLPIIIQKTSGATVPRSSVSLHYHELQSPAHQLQVLEVWNVYKVKDKVIPLLNQPHTSMMYGGVKIQPHSILSLVIFMPWLFYLWRKAPNFHWKGGLLHPRTGKRKSLPLSEFEPRSKNVWITCLCIQKCRLWEIHQKNQPIELSLLWEIFLCISHWP
jgi:hypothetical protein